MHLTQKEQIPTIAQKRRSRILAHFKVKTQISYDDDVMNNNTRLFLITGDRPGLLATVSRVLLDLNIHLHNAKIVTAGERAEDMFYISNAQNQVLTLKEKDQLRQKLIQELS